MPEYFITFFSTVNCYILLLHMVNKISQLINLRLTALTLLDMSKLCRCSQHGNTPYKRNKCIVNKGICAVLIWGERHSETRQRDETIRAVMTVCSAFVRLAVMAYTDIQQP